VEIATTRDLSELYKNITQERGKPLDFWEITALLEVYGIRDIDAQKEYGFENVFEMAKYMMRYRDIQSYPTKSLVNFEDLPPLFLRMLKNYLRGLAFAMPMFVQIFFTLSIGYAIWSGLEMDKTKATVIAVGTFLALIVTGASAQAIGRKGLFYLKQGEVILAANITKKLLSIGYVFVFGIGFILILFNIFFEIFPTYYFFIMIAFYFLLSILFLNVAIYYMFEEYNTILLFFIVGVLFTYISHSILKVRLPEAQFISLLVLDAIIVFFTFIKIRNLKRKDLSAEGEGTPRASILFYSLIPFYLYGFLYFIFLVTDRMVAWSNYIEAKPYFIWFNVPYELGLDWALIALVLLMGLTEISIHEFMYRINDLVIKYKYHEYQKFNNKIYGFFKKFNLAYLIVSIIIIILTYYAVYLLDRYTDYGFTKDFFKSFTPFIYWVAAVSYAFMVNGLMNVLFMFSFSRQNFSVKAIFTASIVNLLIGVILSRMFGLEYAIYGLLFGSIVFWAISFYYSVKMFKKLEYYYYSSF